MGIAGALELYFAEPDAFLRTRVHTCQLMGGLITEALRGILRAPGRNLSESDARPA